MKQKLEIRTFYFIQDNETQYPLKAAQIKFDKKTSEWRFLNCSYEGLKKTYDFNDWKFLKEVAEKIFELSNELNK